MADRSEQVRSIVDQIEQVRDRILDTLEGDDYFEFRVWIDRRLRSISLEIANLSASS